MKFILILFFLFNNLFISNILSFAENIKTLNVVDYFQIIPSQFFLNQRELINQKTKFLNNKSNTLEIERKVIKDIDNGFLEISLNSDMTSTKWQIALFKNLENKVIIGISSRYLYQSSYDSKLVFLSYENNDWINITTNIFPNITYESYLNDNIDKNKYKKLNYVLSNSIINYDLPRYGTMIKAIFYGPNTSLKINDIKDEDNDLYLDFNKSLKTKSLNLIWNITNSIFIINK